MLLRGIAAGAARVSRAPPSALPTVVHDNAIPGNSGQATRQDVIKSRTSLAIGIIFLAAKGSAGIIEAMTYFGTYAVNERHHKLTLHVEYCLFRSCDNTNRTAELKIVGDTMELISTVDTSPTGASYSHTVWKRSCCK